MVWNAVVLEKLGHPSHYLLDARQAGLEADAAWVMVALLDELARRKREAPEDLRLIGHIEAFVDPAGQIRLRASTAAPPSAP